MMIAFQGPELYAKVLVRRITEGASLNAVPLEVDGIFLVADIGPDGVVHLDIMDIIKAISEAKPIVVGGPPAGVGDAE